MIGEVVVRPARAAEMTGLGALQLRASLAWGELTEELLGLPEAAVVPAEHLADSFVVEVDGRVAGFATLLPGDGEAELEAIFVEPDRWGEGLGARLMAEAERRARASGAGAIRVIANRRAQGFYAACGFLVTGEAETLFEPAPVTTKALG